MSPLARALRAVEERVGNVVAPRLRSVAREGSADDRARVSLARHLDAIGDAEAAAEVATLSASAARALLAELGHGPRGGAWTGEAREVRVEVLLTEAEAEEMDRLRGDVGRSEWLARAAGVRR